MTYNEAIQFLYDLRLFGVKLGSENTFRLAELAGNPQNQLRFIHVAGTNGKGSTCAMLESIYRAAGLRVGLFTSPHLVSFAERMQVNRQLICEEDVVRLVEEIQPLLKTFPWEAHPTFFEVVTVMALRYFAERQCDLVIWETGMGGRLDATNIVMPLACVITSIGLDHQEWLGDTLEKIAFEKAGIIKPGVPVITATSAGSGLEVIADIARQRASLLKIVNLADTDEPPAQLPAPEPCPLTSSLSPSGEKGARRAGEGVALGFKVPMRDSTIVEPAHEPARSGPTPDPSQEGNEAPKAALLLGGVGGGFGSARRAKSPRSSLLGRHQRLNAALALATVRALAEKIPVTDQAIREGFAHLHWPGRTQRVETASGQTILLDGAHNPASMEALRAVLQEDFPHSKPTVVFGVLADKDWKSMSALLAPLASRLMLVPVKSERSQSPTELLAIFEQANPAAPVATCSSLAEALDQTAHDPFVVITGSLYLVGEAMELLHLSFIPARDERGLNEWNVS